MRRFLCIFIIPLMAISVIGMYADDAVDWLFARVDA